MRSIRYALGVKSYSYLTGVLFLVFASICPPAVAFQGMVSPSQLFAPFQAVPALNHTSHPSARNGVSTNGGVITGKVRNADTGRPIVLAEVFLGTKVTLTDGYGNYFFRNVGPGTYTLSATALNYIQESRTLTVLDQSWVYQDFHLRRSTSPPPTGPGVASVYGLVLNAENGRAIQGALITGFVVGQIASDEHGRFSVQVVPGHFDFEVQAPGFRSSNGSLTLGDGEHISLTIRLQPEARRLPLRHLTLPGMQPRWNQSTFVITVPSGGVIGDALDQAAQLAGRDTEVVVMVEPGVYQERLSIPSYVTLRSWDPFNTVIAGDSSVPGLPLVRFENAFNATLDGFTLTRGLAITGGAVLMLNSRSTTVQNCVFQANGAVYSGGAVAAVDSMDPVIHNCLIFDNTAYVQGGGISFLNIRSSPHTNPWANVSHCTIADNWAPTGGGIHGQDSNVTVVNSQMVQNHGSGVTGSSRGQLPRVFSSNSWGNSSSNWGALGNQAGFSGNFSADPRFETGRLSRYYLQPGSPCIDAGDPRFEGSSLFPLYGETYQDQGRGIPDGSLGASDLPDLGFHHRQVNVLSKSVELIPFSSSARISINISIIPPDALRGLSTRSANGAPPPVVDSLDTFTCESDGIDYMAVTFTVPMVQAGGSAWDYLDLLPRTGIHDFRVLQMPVAVGTGTSTSPNWPCK